MKKINQRMIKSTLNYFHRFLGFKITEEQFLEIIEADKELKADLLEGGGDTMNREWFQNNLAKKITGLDWPCNMDGQDAWILFAKKMRENGPKLGFNTEKFGL